jgi:hypothetical protein
VGQEDSENHRGAALALSARALHRGLRARARPVPGLVSRAVGGGDHEADGAVAGRAARVRRPRPVRRRLRVPAGGRDPREHPAGGAQAVPAGHDRRPRRRPQGAHRPGRRVPGVRGVVGGPAARLRPPRHAGPGAGGRRRGAGVLGRAARGLPADPGTALLVPSKL